MISEWLLGEANTHIARVGHQVSSAKENYGSSWEFGKRLYVYTSVYIHYFMYAYIYIDNIRTCIPL